MCLQATPDDSYTLQMLIPVEPELIDTPTVLDTVAQIGVAIDGGTIFGDAPSGTSGAIPALDPCGGHYDPSGYYHHHFGTESIQDNLDDADVGVTCDQPQDRDALVGFAYDGFAIMGPDDAGVTPTDLDECSGHISDTAVFGEVYHYHLTDDSPNLPNCRVGAAANGKLISPDNDQASLPDTGQLQGGPPGRDAQSDDAAGATDDGAAGAGG